MMHFRGIVVWLLLATCAYGVVPPEALILDGVRLLMGNEVVADDVTRLAYRELTSVLGEGAGFETIARVGPTNSGQSSSGDALSDRVLALRCCCIWGNECAS